MSYGMSAIDRLVLLMALVFLLRASETALVFASMDVVIEEAMSEIVLVRSSWSYNYKAHELVDTKSVSEPTMLSTFILNLCVCFVFLIINSSDSSLLNVF